MRTDSVKRAYRTQNRRLDSSFLDASIALLIAVPIVRADLRSTSPVASNEPIFVAYILVFIKFNEKFYKPYAYFYEAFTTVSSLKWKQLVPCSDTYEAPLPLEGRYKNFLSHS